MPKSPFIQPSDLYEFNNKVLKKTGLSSSKGSTNSTFTGETPPPQTGTGTRQGQLKPNRLATNARHVMKWLVPEQPIVEMYINPEKVIYTHNKKISKQRTKGGFALQYWGEELIDLNISGTTGRSSIEGINVLMDVYRNEQLQFDPYALFLQAERDKAERNSFDNDIMGTLFGDIGDSVLGDAVNILTGSQTNSSQVSKSQKPTLASLAFTVELYWMGEVYRGFFENMVVTEDANQIGWFNYSIKFTATQKRGFRQNYFPWHVSPVHGSGPPKQRPYSFSTFGSLDASAPVGRKIGYGTAFQEISNAATENKRLKNQQLANEKVDPYMVSGEPLL